MINERTIFHNFNTALFLGCCVIATSILLASSFISEQIPTVLQGNLNGNFSIISNDAVSTAGKFMSEWEAANFLTLSRETLELLINSGELAGTYTIFEGEERVFRQPEHPAGGENEPSVKVVA